MGPEKGPVRMGPDEDRRLRRWGGDRVTFSKHGNFVPALQSTFRHVACTSCGLLGPRIDRDTAAGVWAMWVIWLKSSNLIGQIRFSKITSPTIRHSHQNTYIDYVPQNSLTIQIQRENKPRLRHTLALDDNLGQGEC